MCGMNLAFDRALIGPAMWFGLMGEGQPLGRYDDLFAGWCAKVVCDHLGLGVKSGKPYVWHSKASDPLTNLSKEFKGILWQEQMVEFFRGVKLPKEATTAAAAYAVLAAELRASALPAVDPYFLRVAEGMETWLEVWKEFNNEGSTEEKTSTTPRVILSEEEKASASARGPASAVAVLLSAAASCAASSSSSLSVPGPVPASAPVPAPAAPALSSSFSLPSKSDDVEERENTAPFTPLMPSSSRPQQQQLVGKGGAVAAAEAAAAAAAADGEEEIAGLFERKVNV